MKQGYTSADTSVNNVKIPAAMTKYKPVAGSTVCDYGCGKYTEHIRAHLADCMYFPYDPYNQTSTVNNAARRYGCTFGYNVIYMCNVLNVIDSEDAIIDALHNAFAWLNFGGQLIIQIYEGNKSGVGRTTKTDCYQRNEKTALYIKYLFDAFYGQIYFKYERHGNILIVTKVR